MPLLHRGQIKCEAVIGVGAIHKLCHPEIQRSRIAAGGRDFAATVLSEPPRGYEWRQVDGNYVLAAAATGVIASALVASAVH